MCELVEEGKLLPSQILTLTKPASFALQSKNVRELLKDGILHINQVLALTVGESLTLLEFASSFLKDESIRELLIAGELTIDQIIKLPEHLIRTLRYKDVRRLLTAGILTVAQLLILSETASSALRMEAVRELLIEGKMTTTQLLILPYEVINAFYNRELVELVKEGKLTIEQMLTFEVAAINALWIEEVRKLLRAGILTGEQIAKIKTFATLFALEDAVVRKLLIDGRLTGEQVLTLSDAASFALLSEKVQRRIAEGTITLEQVLTLNILTSDALLDGDVNELLDANVLTAIQLVELSEDAVSRLLRDIKNPEIKENLINGKVSLEKVVGVFDEPKVSDDQGSYVSIARVHRVAEQSADQLAARYQLMIDGENLQNTLNNIRNYVGNLPSDSLQNEAAKRCVLRILSSGYKSPSKISIKQLLALVFLAIHDDVNRVGNLEDARAQFVEALYEIQRGYNLSRSWVDQGGEDRVICHSAAFNRLIQVLQGIHPDCSNQFIESETAALKLPVVVRDEAQKYLKNLANLNTAEELATFMQLMTQIKKDGVKVIWNHIKDAIAVRMYDEFGSVYHGRADRAFIALIEAGQDAELGGIISTLEKQVKSSWGYQQSRQSGMFFSKEYADYLNEHRQDNWKAQLEYDRRFGLVLKK